MPRLKIEASRVNEGLAADNHRGSSFQAYDMRRPSAGQIKTAIKGTVAVSVEHQDSSGAAETRRKQGIGKIRAWTSPFD
jgi:hypothetical protein